MWVLLVFSPSGFFFERRRMEIRGRTGLLTLPSFSSLFSLFFFYLICVRAVGRLFFGIDSEDALLRFTFCYGLVPITDKDTWTWGLLPFFSPFSLSSLIKLPPFPSFSSFSFLLYPLFYPTYPPSPSILYIVIKCTIFTCITVLLFEQKCTFYAIEIIRGRPMHNLSYSSFSENPS